MRLEIEALDAAGRGVARNAGKVVFVEGAIELGLGLEQARFDQLAGDRPFDKHHLACIARDAAALGVKRIYFKNHSRA